MPLLDCCSLGPCSLGKWGVLDGEDSDPIPEGTAPSMLCRSSQRAGEQRPKRRDDEPAASEPGSDDEDVSAMSGSLDSGGGTLGHGAGTSGSKKGPAGGGGAGPRDLSRQFSSIGAAAAAHYAAHLADLSSSPHSPDRSANVPSSSAARLQLLLGADAKLLAVMSNASVLCGKTLPSLVELHRPLLAGERVCVSGPTVTPGVCPSVCLAVQSTLVVCASVCLAGSYPRSMCVLKEGQAWAMGLFMPWFKIIFISLGILFLQGQAASDTRSQVPWARGRRSFSPAWLQSHL